MNTHNLSIDDLQKRIAQLKSELKAAETLLAELAHSSASQSQTHFSIAEKLKI